MEVVVEDAQTGSRAVVEVGQSDSVEALRLKAAVVLRYDAQDVVLQVDGATLAGQSVGGIEGDTIPISACEALQSGAHVDVVVSGGRFVQGLREGRVEFHTLPDYAQHDRDCVIAAVQHKPCSLFFASEAFRDDTEVVLAAVSAGSALQFASDRLKHDRSVVLAAVKADPSAFIAVPDNAFRDDKEIMLRVVETHGIYFKQAPPDLRDDRQVAMAAVLHNGYALEHASSRLQADREVVVAAVSSHGTALQHASAPLRGDREVVALALKHDGLALRYAADALTHDKDLVLEAIQQNAYAVEHAGEALLNDTEVAIAAVRGCPDTLHHLPAMHSNREVLLEAVQRDKESLRYAPEDLQQELQEVASLWQSDDGFDD